MLTARDLRPFYQRAQDVRAAEQLKTEFARKRQEQVPFYLTAVELESILRWKLRGQYDRQARRRRANTDALIRAITRCAFEVSHPDPAYELELRVGILMSLRGVGVPVASAVLALVRPDQYAVIDFRGWRQLFGEERHSFTIGDYRRYLARVRALARRLDWPPQEVDLAIWAYDMAQNTKGFQ